MIERTLSIIKPDATVRRLTKKINRKIRDSALKIIIQKTVLLNIPQARQFYAIHEKKLFFPKLLYYITSAPVIVQVLEGENAIVKNRVLIGATDPRKALSGTIRKDFACDIEQNIIHGSDSQDAAKQEISFFFYFKILA